MTEPTVARQVQVNKAGLFGGIDAKLTLSLMSDGTVRWVEYRGFLGVDKITYADLDEQSE